LLRAVDEYQQGHDRLAFPVAVVKKFGDDQAGKLAALIAYYGFFSLFPLMLVLVTVLGFLLGHNSGFANDIVHSVLSKFPIIGNQISVHSLRGSGVALAVGIVGSLWGGMGVVRALQNAMDEVWDVPRKQRPNFVKSRLRALLLLLVLGAGVIVTTVLAGAATVGTGHALWVKLLGIVLSTAVNLALFLAAFKLLTVAEVSLRQLLPGAVVAAVGFEVLQAVGGYYLGHTLKGASQTYGTLAFVIGLLSWIYLQAQVTLLAAEINVVRVRHLWPRSLLGQEMTGADERTLRSLAKVEERRQDEDVAVTFQKTGS
jgi:YihY family inner membrane protein